MPLLQYLATMSCLLLPWVFTAQSMVAEIPLEKRIEFSTTILEGKIVNKRSFWDDQHLKIFTANTVEVFKVFKGNVKSEWVEVITKGGTVGFTGQIDQPSQQYSLQEVGIFLLEKNEAKTYSNIKDERVVFQPSVGPQSFIEYDLVDGTAHDLFSKYPGPGSTLIKYLEKKVGHPHIEIEEFVLKPSASSASRMAVTISSFSPTSTTAGTDALLIISGSGFGATPGTVDFSNAIDGGASYTPALSSDIFIWNDTEIQVRVPYQAGTGTIRVTNSIGESRISNSALTIEYSQYNVEFNSNSYETQLINADGNGGYTLQFFTDFANSSAATPFARALQTWCNASNAHFSLGANTTVDQFGSDGTNVVRFDNGSELPPGVLGLSTSYVNVCFSPPSNFNWYVTEIDFTFDDGANWNFSTALPSASQYDFETVALKEIGRAHQLYHSIDPSSAMHFSISNGEARRTLNFSDIAGAIDVYLRSTTSPICSQPLMSTGVNCAALILPVELTRFFGYKDGSQNVIEWETSSEINVREHVLERSPNGMDDYETIGKLTGSNHSRERIKYQIIDESPLPIAYYRLTTFDHDGSMERHKVISLKRNNEQFQFQAPRPNPVSRELLLPVTTPRFSAIKYHLTNQVGQMVQRGNFEITDGQHLLKIEMEHLPSGVYFLDLLSSSEKQAFKVIKN